MHYIRPECVQCIAFMINLFVDKRHLLSLIGCSRFSVSFSVGAEFNVTVGGTGTVGVETPPFSEALSEAALDAEVEVVVVDVVEDMEGRVVVEIVVVLVGVVVVLGVAELLTEDKVNKHNKISRFLLHILQYATFDVPG